MTSAPTNLSALPAEATTGKWGPLVNWDIVPLHIHLLPTGKLLAWGKFEPGGTVMGMPRLWDPASGPPTGAREIAVDTMLFCSGHAFMSDGRLMISGGHKQDNKGIDVTNIFDPGSETFVPGLPKIPFIAIGLLMLSDMLPEKDKYDIVGVLPRKICTPVPVVGFISTHASDPAGAKELLQYLASPDAEAIWKEAGYEPHS